MDIDSCFRLGHIVKSHGLKGEVSILLDVDDPQEYNNLESVFVLQEQGLVPFFIEHIRLSGDGAIIKFETVGSYEETEPLKGRGLYLPLKLLPKKGPDGFYYHDVIGFTAFGVDGSEIGTIADYYTNGPQDILAIEHSGREILVPVVDEFIVRVDNKEGHMYFDLPAGLVELYTNED